MDSVLDYARTAAVINRVAPDVVMVQELDSANERSAGINAIEEIAKHSLMHWTYGAAIDYRGGKYGIGMLSKEKPVGHKVVPLPGREEARAFLLVEFKDYFVGCTHFSLNPEDRAASVQVILDAVKNIKKPLFIGGDLNCTYESAPLVALREHFTLLSDQNQPTFPAPEPKECIDYIFGLNNGNGYSRLYRAVVNEPIASDHRPLFVDIRMKARLEDIFRTKPYLQNPTGNGITVSWFTNVPVESWVEYGIGGKLDQRAELFVDGQKICNDTHEKIRLENLEPGQTYSYRVCSREITVYEAYRKEFGETAISDTYTFRLPSSKDTDFTAVILNDIHQQRPMIELHTKMFKELGSWDFVVFNGDVIDDPKNADQAINSMTLINDMASAASKPVFYMRGNHEIRNAFSIGLRDLFDYIGDKTYCAFNWGDTRIVMLDCGEDKPDSTWVYYGLNDFNGLREDQADFLRHEMKTKEFKKADRRILIHHIPIYGMREGGYNPSFEKWGDILAKAPFDVSLNGHTHRFAYHPKGSVGNNFPVIVGGGNRPQGATFMILQKKGKTMTLRVLDPNDGSEKLKLDL